MIYPPEAMEKAPAFYQDAGVIGFLLSLSGLLREGVIYNAAEYLSPRQPLVNDIRSCFALLATQSSFSAASLPS